MPLGLRTGTDQRTLPLLLGTYVQVELVGRPAVDTVALPRSAIREGDQVWTVAEGEVLAAKPVKLVAREREHVLVRGLEPGVPVVLTSLPSATEGMEVSIAPTTDPPAEATPEPHATGDKSLLMYEMRARLRRIRKQSRMRDGLVEELRTKVRKVLSDPGYTKKAREISARTASYGGAARAACLIEGLAI